MFDMGSTSTLYSCLFDVTIHLSSLFIWEPLGPGLMMFSTYCISCTRGMGIIIIGIFKPCFLSFLSPYYLSLRYVSCLKTTLRPLLHIVFYSSHVGNTWAWSEIISRSMMNGKLRGWFTLGHTLLISDGFSEAIWSILGHTPITDDGFFRDDALHWGIFSSLLHLDYDGLGVVGWPYTGAYPFQGAPLLEIQSLYSILCIGTHSTHWWLISEMTIYVDA